MILFSEINILILDYNGLQGPKITLAEHSLKTIRSNCNGTYGETPKKQHK